MTGTIGTTLQLAFIGFILITLIVSVKKSFQYGFTCEGIPKEKIVSRLLVKTGNTFIFSVLTCWAMVTLGSLLLGITASINEVETSASMLQESITNK